MVYGTRRIRLIEDLTTKKARLGNQAGSKSHFTQTDLPTVMSMGRLAPIPCCLCPMVNTAASFRLQIGPIQK